jgi:hypothetical protein
MTQSWPIVAAASALFVLSAVQAWLLWRLSRMVAGSARLEEKVGRLADALSILTETSEAGFKAIADELARHAVAGPSSATRPRTPIARLKAAAKRGASIAEIAAAEHMSEGEVRLRLHLAEHAKPAARPRIAPAALDGDAKGAGDALRA